VTAAGACCAGTKKPETGRCRVDLSVWCRREDYPKLGDAYKAALKILHGQIGTLVKDALEVHLEDLRTRGRRESTIQARKTKVNAFLGWAGRNKELKTITAKLAGQYRTEVLMRSGRALKTIKGDAAHLKAFGGWCVDAGYLDANPFERITKRLEGSTRGSDQKTKVRYWEEHELVRLLQGIKTYRGAHDPLWGLTILAMYTGCRAEEIASLELENLHLDAEIPYLHVSQGKTEASIRDVPLHPNVIPVVKELVSKRTEGRLFKTLKPGGEDSKYFHGQSKRFTTLTRKTLKIFDPTLKFHSLRHNVKTMLRRAGVADATVDQLQGWSRAGAKETYDHGLLLEQLASAIAKVRYGEAVETLII
jgi:integrase